MCHHVPDAIYRSWLREHDDEAAEEESTDRPSFLNERSDVDVELLDASD